MSQKIKFESVSKKFEKIAAKNAKELEYAQIRPIHEAFPFAQNGMHVMIAQPGCGKSRCFINMIANLETLFDELFIEDVVICSTSADFDETVKTFKCCIEKTTLTPVKDHDLLTYLDEYCTKYLLHKTLMKFVNNNLKNPCEEMMKIIAEKNLHNKKKLVEYIAKTLADIKWKTYPHRLWLNLDDFSSHPLLKNKATPLSRLLKKLRHFNINVTIVVQTTKSIPLDLKRILTDCTLFPGISYNDFMDLMKDSPLGFVDPQTLWNSYNSIDCKHTMFTIHVTARRVIITPPYKK
jgi:hypothetical protein